MRNAFNRIERRCSRGPQICGPANAFRGVILFATSAISAILLAAAPASAEPPKTTVDYQPMVSTGLAAKEPFEAWFVFDKSLDPTVPGYAVLAGTTVRFTFPKEFTPQGNNPHLEGAILKGWPHGAIPVPFTVAQDKINPRVVIVRIDQAISSGPAEKPGLKAIHVRTGELNPAEPGDYPISVQFADAGPLTGTTTAVAHITEKPVANIAAYNQLHQSKDEDWQRVKAGTEAALPIDFLVTLPDESRSSITLTPASGTHLNILSDDKPIGTITTKGVPITLSAQPFGPGFARLGIIEVHVRAGTRPGAAQIVASLNGGTQYVVNLIVEGP
jgi:hypothetical protein